MFNDLLSAQLVIRSVKLISSLTPCFLIQIVSVNKSTSGVLAVIVNILDYGA